MKRVTLIVPLVIFAGAGNLFAAVDSTTTHGPLGNSLDGSIAVGDLISGLIATELAGDLGWHPANPAVGDSLHPFGLPTFTNDAGGAGLAGLLNDFPPAGSPTKVIQYDLAAPSDIGEIRILTGNDGLDGRVFSTTVISISDNGGGSFSTLGYFQSDPSGTLNAGQFGSTLVRVFDDVAPRVSPIATGVTNLIFEFFAVDNTGNQMRDPYDGVNPFTGVDDGLTAAFVAPLVWEIDVLAPIPEPASVCLLSIGLVAGLLPRRRVR